MPKNMRRDQAEWSENSRDGFVAMRVTGRALTHIMHGIYQNEGKAELLDAVWGMFNGQMSPEQAMAIVEGKATLTGESPSINFEMLGEE